MAIVIRQSTNSAIQYNETGLDEYLINDANTDKKFLTFAPNPRTLKQSELSVIDFLINDTSFAGHLMYEYFDADQNIVFEQALNLSSPVVHNSISVNFVSNSPNYVPSNANKVCIRIIQNALLPANPEFILGAGNDFTSWDEQPLGGSITQTTGIGGKRAIRLVKDNGNDLYIEQSSVLTNGISYTGVIYAKTPIDSVIQIYNNIGNDFVAEIEVASSSEFIRYEFDFSSTDTGFIIALRDENTEVTIDRVYIRKSDSADLTETRCFVLDSNCYQHENQIQWVNKLGGKETFVFTGLPIKEKSIERDINIKRPIIDNFSAPNPIYQSRQISSREVISLFTRCNNEDTARWVRNEIFDCVAIYLLIGSEYYPIIPEASSIQVYNENGFNYNVIFRFRFAFDVNIQSI